MMQKAEYPARMCKQAVWSVGDAAHLCELPDLHPGPCASFSVSATVERRDKWEAANPGWEQNVGIGVDWAGPTEKKE